MPTGFLPAAVLEEGALGREDTVFGPSPEFTVAAMVISRTGTYVEVLVVDLASEAPAACRRKPPLRAAMPSGDGAKAKPKRPTISSLAQDMRSMLDALPKFSAELGKLNDRQKAMEVRLPVAGKPPPLPFSRAFSHLFTLLCLSWPKPFSHHHSHGSLGVPGDLKALDGEKLAADPTSSQTSGDALTRAVLVQSQALTTLVSRSPQLGRSSSDKCWRNQGSFSTGKATDGAVFSPWDLLSTSSAEYVSADGSYELSQCFCRGAPAARRQRCALLGKLRRMRKMQGTGRLCQFSTS